MPRLSRLPAGSGGVTIKGDKIPIGFVQAATENERVCRQFIQSLINRDLVYHKGLLCLIDGSKGLYAALTKALDGYVVIQRCQWHKRENVLSYLPKNKQDEIKKALQHAYDQPTYKEAKTALLSLSYGGKDVVEAASLPGSSFRTYRFWVSPTDLQTRYAAAEP